MEEGFSQGAVCSPVIANLYLHYVLVWWLNEQVKPHMKGYGGLVVHADDLWPASNIGRKRKLSMNT